MSGETKQPGPLKSFLAGGAGGICLVLVGHPLDTIKVRIQTMQVVPGQPPPYNGLVDCARKIIAREGFGGLYKGMAAPLAGVAPMYALCFLGYGYGKKIFCDDDAFEKLKLTQIGLAGAFSSFFTTPILGPGERLKCVLQIQAAPDYKGPKYTGYKDLVQSLYKEGGIRSILRGSGITCVRDGVASFFYFSTYGARAASPPLGLPRCWRTSVARAPPQSASRRRGPRPGRTASRRNIISYHIISYIVI